MLKNTKGVGMYIAMLVLLSLLAVAMFSMGKPVSKYKYHEIINYFKQDQVENFVVDFNNGDLLVTVKNQKEQVLYELPDIGLFLQDIRPYVEKYEVDHPDQVFEHDYIPAEPTPFWISMLPTIILVVLMIVFYVLMMRQAGGGGGKMASFGKAKPKPLDDGRKVTFADVAGADEEKEELVEVVEFLKNPKKFSALGARIPKGVLLMGPPGTGKTLLARAVAGEAGVPFFSISGSDFVEMFVGVGASRVRDLFDQAKKSAPSIVFIDEIDAVGRHRGAGLGGGHDEREQTLNQLLVEMDGFASNTGVIVMAATNRRDILDPALLRPGRFDRQIVVSYPDIKGREEILRVHTKNKPIGPDVNLGTIAKTTAGFTGADLENLVNEAALLAARKNKKAITMEEIEAATIKVVAGPEKKSHVVPDKDKRLTAFHEAGHAIATYYSKTQDPVHEISIIPRGMAGGYTMSLPAEDKNYATRKEMFENIITLLGGRIAEQLVLDDISTGASNDLERVTKIATNMVTRYGFSEKLGPLVYGQDQNEVFLGRDFGHTRDYSENVASEIDAEVRRFVDGAYEKCTQILQEHMEQLHQVAEYLFQYEKLNGEDFAKIMEGEKDAVYAAREQEAEKRRQQHKGEGGHAVHNPHQHRVYAAAGVAGHQSDQNADHRAHGHAAHSHQQRYPSAIDQTGEHIPPQAVGPQKEAIRSGLCVNLEKIHCCRVSAHQEGSEYGHQKNKHDQNQTQHDLFLRSFFQALLAFRSLSSSSCCLLSLRLFAAIIRPSSLMRSLPSD